MSEPIAFAFVVHGPPVPCARARVVNGHAFTPKTTRDYQKLVELCARAAMPIDWRADWASYRVEVTVYRAKDTGDADNFYKSAADALANAGVFENDKRVHFVQVAMALDTERPRLEVHVELLDYETHAEASKRRARKRSRKRTA